jgi:Fur family ferric uptake transcriptional regulator
VAVPNELIAQVMERVRAEARTRGVRWTSQRQAIVEQFLLAGEHLTAEALHQRVHEIEPGVGAATVYRTLNLLVEIGVATRVRFGASSAYESALGREHHDHLVCLACGRIHEFHDERIEAIQDAVAKRHGFVLRHHRLELFGVCPDCQKRA